MFTRIFRETTEQTKLEATKIAVAFRGEKQTYSRRPIRWTIDGYDLGKRYLVDTDGVVWDTTPRGKKAEEPVKLKIEKTEGKRRVWLAVPNGKHKRVAVHRLVATTFLGITQEDLQGLDVHHIDGDSGNNSPLNLMVMPHSLHMHVEAILRQKGLKRKRYTTADERMITQLHRRSNVSISALARRYGLNLVTVQNIIGKEEKRRAEMIKQVVQEAIAAGFRRVA